jgi:hypothetical protein
MRDNRVSRFSTSGWKKYRVYQESYAYALAGVSIALSIFLFGGDEYLQARLLVIETVFLIFLGRLAGRPQKWLAAGCYIGALLLGIGLYQTFPSYLTELLVMSMAIWALVVVLAFVTKPRTTIGVPIESKAPPAQPK